MKDKVFIVWSGQPDAAHRIAEILHRESDYLCIVGGSFEHIANSGAVLHTVITQIKECNQAIVIFANKKEEQGIGRNLVFELGYALALYGTKKVHCVRRYDEEIRLPSDFDGSFVEPIRYDSGSADSFERGVVQYFLKRQNLAVETSKFKLINERYKIKDMMDAHYSEQGSRCSDYELAQYVLFYMQGAHMFREDAETLKELIEYKTKHPALASSDELSASIRFSIAALTVMSRAFADEAHGFHLSEEDFYEFEKTVRSLKKEACYRDPGSFGLWFRCFVADVYNYALMLFANVLDDEGEREETLDEAREVAEETLNDLDELCNGPVMKDITQKNNDAKGLIALLRSYIYRNQYLALRETEAEKPALPEDDPDYRNWHELRTSVDWLVAAKNIRYDMMEDNKNGEVDSRLYTTFCMEYNLALSEFLLLFENELDRHTKHAARSHINSFLQKAEAERSSTDEYIRQIQQNYVSLQLNKKNG